MTVNPRLSRRTERVSGSLIREILKVTQRPDVISFAGGLPADDLPEVNHPVAVGIGYHLRTGKHDVTDYDWDQYLNFADRHFRRAGSQ